jgi:hypothetical protein
LRQNGINAILFPCGYSPYYEQAYKENLGGIQYEEDIDVLIYATPTPRREKIIRSLRQSGLKITWLGRDQDDNPGTLPKRDEYIARAKIVLSVVHNEPYILGTNDFARLIYLIANKKFIICESVGDDVEKQWTDHVTLTSVDKIKALCDYYLNRPEERQVISDKAYDYAVKNFQLKELITNLV